MPLLTERDLECILCRRRFRAELGGLEAEQARQRAAALLAERGLADPAAVAHVLEVIRRPNAGQLPPWQPGR